MSRRGHILVAFAAPTDGAVPVSMTTGWVGATPQPGDQLIAFVLCDTATAVLGAPSGWASVPASANASETVARGLWLEDATGIADTVNFPVSGTAPGKVLVVAYDPEGELLLEVVVGSPAITNGASSVTLVGPTVAGAGGTTVRVSFFGQDSFALVEDDPNGAPLGGTLIAVDNANSCTVAAYDWQDDGPGDKQDTIVWATADTGQVFSVIMRYGTAESTPTGAVVITFMPR